MERTMWSDKRLDDLADKMDAGFKRVDADMRELRGDIRGVRTLMVQLWGSTIIGCLGVIATLLATH
jgi:hypothetical protein